MDRHGSPPLRRESNFFTSAHVPRVHCHDSSGVFGQAVGPPALPQADSPVVRLPVAPEEVQLMEGVCKSPPLRPMRPRLPENRFRELRATNPVRAASPLSAVRSPTASLGALDAAAMPFAPRRVVRVSDSAKCVVSRDVAADSGRASSALVGGVIPSIKSLFAFGTATASALPRSETAAPAAAKPRAAGPSKAPRIFRRGPPGVRTPHETLGYAGAVIPTLSRGQLAFSHLVQQANTPAGAQLPCLLTACHGAHAENKVRQGAKINVNAGSSWVDSAGNLWAVPLVMEPSPAAQRPHESLSGQVASSKRVSVASGVEKRSLSSSLLHAASVKAATPAVAVGTLPAGRGASQMPEAQTTGAAAVAAPGLHALQGVAHRREVLKVTAEQSKPEGPQGARPGGVATAHAVASQPREAQMEVRVQGLEAAAGPEAGHIVAGGESHVLLEFGQAYPDGVLKACKKIVEVNPDTNRVETRLVHKLMIHESPDVFIMPELLSPATCDKLVAMCQGRWQPSKTSRGPLHALPSEYSSGESLSRTSMSVRLAPGETPEVENLENIVAAFADMPVSHLEPLVVVKYEEGEFFKQHHDGQFRRITILVYLNDVAHGGETEFPHLGLRLSPTKGSAVMWRNVFESNQIDPRVLHAGLPTLAGKKYVINCFFNQRPVRFASPTEGAVNGSLQQLPKSEPRGPTSPTGFLASPSAAAAPVDQQNRPRPNLAASAAAPQAIRPGQSPSVECARTISALRAPQAHALSSADLQNAQVSAQRMQAAVQRASTSVAYTSGGGNSATVTAGPRLSGVPTTGSCATNGAHTLRVIPEMPQYPMGEPCQVPHTGVVHPVHAGKCDQYGHQLPHYGAASPHTPGYVSVSGSMGMHAGSQRGGTVGGNHTANFVQMGATMAGAMSGMMGGNAGANFFSSAPAFMMVFGPNGVPQMKPLTQEQVDDGVGKYLIMEAMQNMTPPVPPTSAGRRY
ncbi:UNVERIFIED_CONTAM: oxidoreductase, 2OG-Fe(II) oxygenase family protein [Hammondia hammondi]|eukprot:XP_008889217.1 oxidoreductase, 2OG-Fe(II) oxygenase family protein [Hammondia hammondi]